MAPIKLSEMKCLCTSRRRAAAAAVGASLLAACSAGGDPEEAPAGPPAPEIAAGAYLPDDGLIVVELESGSAAGGWSEETAISGFTGTSYLRWTGANLFNSPGQDAFGFDLWIDDPGIYQFRIHNRHDDPDPTMSNDVFVRMDGGDWIKVFSSTRGVWTWASRHEFSANNKPQAEYTLGGGNHRIEFSGRSFDFSIDRFHLYDPGVANPLDTAHPESSRFGVSGTPPGIGSGDVRAERIVQSAPNRRLVLGPLVARRGDDVDPTVSWDIALRTAAPLERTVEVAVVGSGADWSDDLDPHAIGPGLARHIRDLPRRWADRGELRWTFEAGPAVVPATLDRLAERVRANDPGGRPLVLRVMPSDLIARWPEVLHSSFDAIVLLRVVGDASATLDAALELIERSGRSFAVEIEVGADLTPEG